MNEIDQSLDRSRARRTNRFNSKALALPWFVLWYKFPRSPLWMGSRIRSRAVSVFFLAFVGCTDLTNSRMKIDDADLACPDALAESALVIAREKFPDSLPLYEKREGRIRFISGYIYELFGKTRPDHLTFREYLSAVWAEFNVLTPPNNCKISKSDFFKTVFWIDAFAQFQIDEREEYYKFYDSNGKGYVTKRDFISQSKGAFMGMDRNRDGLLAKSETHGGNF